MRRRDTGPSRAVRDLIRARANGLCERCCRPLGLLADLHHRHPRRMGGTKREWVNSVPACVLLCRVCHRWVESQRSVALASGWLVREGTDPETVPVTTTMGRRMLLHSDGTLGVRVVDL